MYKIKNIVLNILLITIISFSMAGVVFAAEDKGDWNEAHKDRWEEGWSEWSLTPTGYTGEVKMNVYLKPNWGNEIDSIDNPGGNIYTPSNSACTNGKLADLSPCVVRKNNSTDNRCDGGTYEDPVPATCGNKTDRWAQETNGECACTLTGSYTGSYTQPGGEWWCSSKANPCKGYRNPLKNCTTKCRWYECPTTGLTSSTETKCHWRRMHYLYNQTTSFADPNNKANWNTSLSAAGGYARQVYIYSYPQRVYIVYDGNGADGTCSNANTHGVTGDPTDCSAYGTGVMASGKDVFINYFTSDDAKFPGHRNLVKNEYYRIGYDFLGWSLNKNATTATFADGQSVTAQNLSANAGDTKTLYAIWRKHTYNITYKYYCGSDSALTHTYVYESTPTLKALNLDACKTSEKSGSDYSGANTRFISWYEDSSYNKKIITIPKEYHRDLTLYAKLVQSRSYDYPNYRWKWDQ